MDEAEGDTGIVVTVDQLSALPRLKRGLDPCCVVVDGRGNEFDKWGRVVDREGNIVSPVAEPEEPPA